MPPIDKRTIRIHKLLDELSVFLIDEQAFAKKTTKERAATALLRLEEEYHTKDLSFKLCPHCKKDVKKCAFNEHKRKCLNLKLPSQIETFETQLPEETKMNSTPGYKHKSKSEYSKERMLDETREYAHAYRDKNQYGSHPSYDGHNDESNPD